MHIIIHSFVDVGRQRDREKERENDETRERTETERIQKRTDLFKVVTTYVNA